MFDLNSTIIDEVNAWIRVLRELFFKEVWREPSNDVWSQFNYYWCKNAWIQVLNEPDNDLDDMTIIIMLWIISVN